MLKLILVVIVSYIGLSDACRCLQMSNAEKYCDSEFAGVITIATGVYDCGLYNSKCYGITNVQQIRGNPIDPLVVQTGSSSAECGSTLIPGNTYFVAGYAIDSTALGLNTCQLVEDLDGQDVATVIASYLATSCP